MWKRKWPKGKHIGIQTKKFQLKMYLKSMIRALGVSRILCLVHPAGLLSVGKEGLLKADYHPISRSHNMPGNFMPGESLRIWETQACVQTSPYMITHWGLTCMSLPMIAISTITQRMIRGILGYFSWHTSARCLPIITNPAWIINS